eukprot:7328545-Prymnesium_polylepis.1
MPPGTFSATLAHVPLPLSATASALEFREASRTSMRSSRRRRALSSGTSPALRKVMVKTAAVCPSPLRWTITRRGATRGAMAAVAASSDASHGR